MIRQSKADPNVGHSEEQHEIRNENQFDPRRHLHKSLMRGNEKAAFLAGVFAFPMSMRSWTSVLLLCQQNQRGSW